MFIKDDGSIGDVIPGSPADKAGLAPDMKLIAVNGRRWNPDLLHNAIKAAQKSSAPIELIAEDNEFIKSFALDYHDGEKYPCLFRDHSKPDLIDEILRPLTPAPAVKN
jgi:hypothetical protein